MLVASSSSRIGRVVAFCLSASHILWGGLARAAGQGCTLCLVTFVGGAFDVRACFALSAPASVCLRSGSIGKSLQNNHCDLESVLLQSALMVVLRCAPQHVGAPLACRTHDQRRDSVLSWRRSCMCFLLFDTHGVWGWQPCAHPHPWGRLRAPTLTTLAAAFAPEHTHTHTHHETQFLFHPPNAVDTVCGTPGCIGSCACPPWSCSGAAAKARTATRHLSVGNLFACATLGLSRNPQFLGSTSRRVSGALRHFFIAG